MYSNQFIFALESIKTNIMTDFKNNILKTHNDWTGFIIRLTLGIVLLPHGAQKLLGLFGGYGFNGTMDFFTTQAGLPWIIGFSIIIIEFFGSLALIIGFASRLWSMAIFFLFIGIIYTEQWQNGFFMNWFGTQNGEGFEYSLLVLGIAIAIVIKGSGKHSIDNILTKI